MTECGKPVHIQDLRVGPCERPEAVTLASTVNTLAELRDWRNNYAAVSHDCRVLDESIRHLAHFLGELRRSAKVRQASSGERSGAMNAISRFLHRNDLWHRRMRHPTQSWTWLCPDCKKIAAGGHGTWDYLKASNWRKVEEP